VKNELRPYLLLIILVVAIDQLTKTYVHATMTLGQSKEVLGNFLRFTFVFNPGGAFGITIGNFWLYTAVSLMAVVIIIIYFLKVPNHNRFAKICLAFVVGGALGNQIDRIVYTQVIDFIDINVIDIVIPPFKILGLQFMGYDLYRWYIFNIADAAITLGLIGFVVYLLFQEKFDKQVMPLLGDEIPQDEQSDIKVDSTGE
jgi:signal peptidase II